MRRLVVSLIVSLVPALCLGYMAIPRVGGLNVTNPAGELATAVYANPAAMGLIDASRFFADITPTYFVASFEREGKDPDTGEPYEESGFATLIPVPFLSAIYVPKLDWLKAGVGFYTPFGRITNWPEEGSQRYQLTKLTILDIVLSFAVAVRIAPSLWVGGAIEPRYERFETARSLDIADYVPAMMEEMLGVDVPKDIIPPNLPEWEGRLSADADGFAFGWTCGILAIPIHWIKLGLTYHSQINVKVNGDFELTVPDKQLALFGILNFPGGVQQMLEDLAGVEAPSVIRGSSQFKYVLPQVVAMGFNVGPIKKWRFLAHLSWTDWIIYDYFESKLKPDNTELELPEDRIPLKNVPSWLVGVIVAREHLQKNLWGFGIDYETDSIPKEYACAYNINAPKLDFMGFYRWQAWTKIAVGFGASYVYWFEKKSDHTEIDRAGASEGTYNVNVFRLGVNVDVAF